MRAGLRSVLHARSAPPHATDPQALAWLLLEPLNRLPQSAVHQLGIPIDPVQRVRHDVLLRPINRLGELTERPLYADVLRTNVGSLRVLQKCGFRLLNEDERGADHDPKEYTLRLG